MNVTSLSQLQFFSSPLAKQMLRHEKYWLRKQLRTCVGSHAALITTDPYARCAPLFSDFYVLASISDEAADRNSICCLPEALPLANESIDVVVLQHVTELSADPVHVFREAERVLAPGGRLLIMAENPASLFGLGRWFSRRDTPSDAQACTQYSLSKLNNWLSALDIQVVSQRSVFHELPLNNERLLGYTFRFAIWCAKHFMPFGGVYCISAIKVARPVNLRRLRTLSWRPNVGQVANARSTIPDGMTSNPISKSTTQTHHEKN